MVSESFQSQSLWRRATGWFARNELLWLALAAPFLLFPNRWTPLAAALIVAVWPARRLASGSWTRNSPLNAPSFLILVMAIAGALVSMDYAVTEAKWWGIFLQVAIFFALLNSLRSELSVQRLTALLMVVGLGVVILGFVGTNWDSVRMLPVPGLYDLLPQIAMGLPNSGAGRAQEFFHPRQIGHTLGMLLPLAYTLLVFGRPWWLRLPAGLFALLGTILLLLSSAIMGLFGLLAGLALVAVWWRRWLLIPIAAGLLGLGLFIWLNEPQSQMLRVLDLADSLGLGIVLRLDMWSRALAMIRDMPFTGIGLNTFPLVQSHFYTGYAIGPEPHAHQLWLQTALDLGLPGLVAFLWLLLAFAYTSISAYRAADNRQMQVLLVGLAASVLAFVAAGTLDLSTLGSKPVAGLWAMFGLAAAVWANEREQGELQPGIAGKASTAWGLTGLFLLTIVATLLIFPASRSRNLGLLQAHRAIYQARRTGQLPLVQAEQAITFISNALDEDPAQPQLLGTRGSLFAWLGEEDKALEDLAQRVRVDSRNPLKRYAPFVAWRSHYSDEKVGDDVDGLIDVYSRWRNRFPDRAEGYILLGIALQNLANEPERSIREVEKAVERGAKPGGLLEAYLRQPWAGD